MSGDLVVVGSSDPARTADLAGALPGSSEPVTEGATVRFRVPDGATTLPVLLRELDAAGVAMTSVEVRRPSLDDVFLTVTGRSLRDAEQGDAEQGDAERSPEGSPEPAVTVEAAR